MSTIRTVERRRVRRLEQDAKRGVPLTNITQEDRDVLHRKPTEENLLYWIEERKKAAAADDVERILTCDRMRRLMLLVTVPEASDGGMDDILGHMLEKFEELPKEH